MQKIVILNDFLRRCPLAWLRFVILLICFSTCRLEASESRIELFLPKKVSHGYAGQTATIQARISNRGVDHQVLTGHLTLPPNWRAVPANDVLFSLAPGQTILQTLTIAIPAATPEGDYSIAYRVNDRENINVADYGICTLIVENQDCVMPSKLVCHPQAEEWHVVQEVSIDTGNTLKKISSKDQLLSIELTSSSLCEINPNELFFISIMLDNMSDEDIRCSPQISIPSEWTLVPSADESCLVQAQDSCLRVFAIRAPPKTLSGSYPITISCPDETDEVMICRVKILPEVKFSAKIDRLIERYSRFERIPLRLVLKNDSNIPHHLLIEICTDPLCEIFYNTQPIYIEAHSEEIAQLIVTPCQCPIEDNQFLYIKILDADSCEVLCLLPVRLEFCAFYSGDVDEYIRIPSHMTCMALGDNGRQVLAIEAAGGGMIDEEIPRYVEYCVRLPTDSHNVIYSIDQRLFIGMSQPGLNLNLGDTTYILSPLTQRCRYGRGVGFDVELDYFHYGAHYTENTYDNDYNPRESCVYVGFNPADNVSIDANYMYKTVQKLCPSHIITVSSEIDISDNITTEIEAGMDIADNSPHREGGNQAYRFETCGEIGEDTWFDIEKVYAGPNFFGYYNYMDVFSASLDFPLESNMRANISYSRLKQNYVQEEKCEESPSWVAVRQRQLAGCVSCNITPQAVVSINGLLLRARDEGIFHQYDFFQSWGGINTSVYKQGYTFNASCSWGTQKDYLTNQDSRILQKYYAYIGKELMPFIYSSLFFETGNSNYYDARSWRNAFGTSFSGHFNSKSYVEVFLQHVKNSCEDYNLTQGSLRSSHTFSNGNNLQLSLQYFYYKQHYPNDLLFLVAYTIPFGLPVAKNPAIGNLSGRVYNACTGDGISDALISVDGRTASTDEQGRYKFYKLPSGENCLSTELLPKKLITQKGKQSLVTVIGGRCTQQNIPVVPVCEVKGDVILYSKTEGAYSEEISGSSRLKDVRMTLTKLNEEEAYSQLTNGNGQFCFTNLRPGKWLLHICEETLPQKHLLSANDLILELEPDEEKTVTFEVKPVIRRIQPLSQGHQEEQRKLLGLLRKVSYPV